MSVISSPSPNFDHRDDAGIIDMLVLHYTGMKSGPEALERLCDPTAKVSAHYLVEEDGQVYQLVSEEMRAWHAGVSFWRGHRNINARSIGIEIVNPGHEWGYRAFPQVQIESIISLCKIILTRHPIVQRNIVGHSDVAPERKTDPGELFPWRELSKQGIGLWPEAPIETKASVEELLFRYGYELEDPNASLEAFRRHYHPEDLGNPDDAKSRALLASLLDQCV